MADDGYVTIHRTTDAAQGGLMAELLRRAGIDARFHDVASKRIGMPPALIEMTVDVPAESEAQARELLADLEYAGAAEELERGEEGAETEPPLRARRYPLLAAGFALILPGGAHVYARRPWTALVLAIGVVASLVVMAATRTKLTIEFAFATLIVTVLCDAVAGVRAARADDRGEQRSRGQQIVRGLTLLAAAVAVGGGVRFATAAQRVKWSRELAKYKVSCTDREIFVENQSGRPRVIQLWQMRVGATSRTGHELYTVGIKGADYFTVAPGERATFTPAVGDWLARSCGFSGVSGPPSARELPSRPFLCGFVFGFGTRDPYDDPHSLVYGYGYCVPAEGHGGEATGELGLLAR